MKIVGDLIRHGEPEDAAKYRGQLDEFLSKLGWPQRDDALSAFKADWDLSLSSPQSRSNASNYMFYI